MSAGVCAGAVKCMCPLCALSGGGGVVVTWGHWCIHCQGSMCDSYGLSDPSPSLVCSFFDSRSREADRMGHRGMRVCVKGGAVPQHALGGGEMPETSGTFELACEGNKCVAQRE